MQCSRGYFSFRFRYKGMTCYEIRSQRDSHTLALEKVEHSWRTGPLHVASVSLKGYQGSMGQFSFESCNRGPVGGPMQGPMGQFLPSPNQFSRLGVQFSLFYGQARDYASQFETPSGSLKQQGGQLNFSSRTGTPRATQPFLVSSLSYYLVYPLF